MVNFFDGHIQISLRLRTMVFVVCLFSFVLMTGFSLGAAIFVYQYVPADIAMVKADTMAMRSTLQDRIEELNRNAEAYRLLIANATRPRPKNELPEKVSAENRALGVGGN